MPIDSGNLYDNVKYDYIEVLQLDDATLMFDSVCQPTAYPGTACNTALDNLSGGQYIRLVIVRNIPAGADSASVMKEVNVIVLWAERTWTRSVNIRTLIGRKDYDFF